MKKLLVSILLLFGSASLFSEVPIIKFYLQDGSTKQYNLYDIDSLSVTKYNLYVMHIYYQDTNIAYYPNEIIQSVKIEDINNNLYLNVYIYGYAKPYPVIDIDSIVFKIDKWQPLTIGKQVWMLKNLNVDHYRNGDTIPQVTDPTQWLNLTTGAWCYYNNDPVMGAIYGKLYNWYAVNDPRGLAPDGWHVPTDAEWTILTNYLGGESVAGGKLKEAGTAHWKTPNDGATNESGFSTLPGGWRRSHYGTFNNIGNCGGWWSATESDPTDVWGRYLYYSNTSVNRADHYKEDGFSARCVRDYPIPIITNINPTSAKIGDEITITGTGFSSFRATSKVTFGTTDASDYTSWSATIINVIVPAGAKTGKLWVVVDGEKSNEVDFTLKLGNPCDIEPVTIGTQIWMGCNLNVDTYRNGDPIPQVTDPTQWKSLTTGAWCYFNNDPDMGAIYGKLYNWYAVNDPRGLAPDGWHVATDAEWTILTNYLGGVLEAGGKLKEAGTAHWNHQNEGATNKSGFSALPGGWRYYGGGAFSGIGCYGYWWSATEVFSNAWYRGLFCGSAYVSRYDRSEGDGLSVRCVRD